MLAEKIQHDKISNHEFEFNVNDFFLIGITLNISRSVNSSRKKTIRVKFKALFSCDSKKKI